VILICCFTLNNTYFLHFMSQTLPLLLGRRILFFLLFFGLVKGANAQKVVTISPDFFHIDSVKKIILISQSAHTLNEENDTLKVVASGGHRLVFTQPVTNVSTAVAYQATEKETTYTLYFTQIPIIHISTKHQIVDAPSVYANFTLSDTTGTLAQSAMGIEIRGAYSQSYPKKSYELSLLADTISAEDQDISLLGMRKDNKWNLQAMYNDALRLRLKLANEMWMGMNQLYYQDKEPAAKSGISMAYAEVFVNDNYQGIYALTERVDRKQLKLKKYTTKIMGELYKGTDGTGGAVSFDKVPVADNNSLVWGGFEYKEPSEETNWTGLHDFVNFVVNSSDADFNAQYKSKFHLDNAVDYYIFLNVLRIADNTGKNIYIAKYKPNEPYYYVPWDLDGVLGNDWQGVNVYSTDGIFTNGLYNRLMKDKSAGGFWETLTNRWAALRATVLTHQTIIDKLNQYNTFLLTNKVYEREHVAWSGYTYDGYQRVYPTNWLTSRLAYLDSVFKPATPLGTEKPQSTAGLQLYPNPASGYITLAFGSAPFELSIQSTTGTTVLHKALAGGKNQVDISTLPQGVYLVRVTSPTATAVQKLLVR
jgi:spore coat protein H